SQLEASFIGYQSRSVPINSSNINISLNEDTQALNEIIEMADELKTLQGRVAGVRVESRAQKAMAPPPPAAAPLATEGTENQTTVEIEVSEPYSIKSNGEKTLVDLKAYEVPAIYRYSVIPKLDNDAFLIAEIADWSQYSLLEGESNLYFEDGFVGRSILNGSALEDTLLVSMGRDQSIAVQREKVEEYSKKRTIGSNVAENRGYEISLRNNKS